MPPSSPSSIAPSAKRSSPCTFAETARANLSKGGALRTVLVVDDDQTVRNIAMLMLQRSGFTTYAASNGLEALHVLQEHPDINVVLLDILMPVMNGAEAFREMRKFWPSIRVVVISGLSLDEANARFASMPPDGVLLKPFTIDTLRAAISGALN